MANEDSRLTNPRYHYQGQEALNLPLAANLLAGDDLSGLDHLAQAGRMDMQPLGGLDNCHGVFFFLTRPPRRVKKVHVRAPRGRVD